MAAKKTKKTKKPSVKKASPARSAVYQQTYAECLIDDKRKTKFCRRIAREADKRAKNGGMLATRIAGLGALASGEPLPRRRTRAYKSEIDIIDHADRRYLISDADDTLAPPRAGMPIYVAAYKAGADIDEDDSLNEDYFDSIGDLESAIKAGTFRGAKKSRGKKKRGLRGPDEDAERQLFRDDAYVPSSDQIASRALARTTQALRRSGGCASSIETAFDLGEGRAAARAAGANARTMQTFQELEGRVIARLRDACGCAPDKKKPAAERDTYHRGARALLNEE